MSEKLPVLARDYPGAEELVIDGRTGFVCSTPHIMATRAREILGDSELRTRLGMAGRLKAEADHSHKNLGRYIDILLDDRQV